MKFYLTFGQSSPLKNGWVEVIAKNNEQARKKVFQEYSNKWSNLYTKKRFKKRYFPQGCLGQLK